jgi:acyl carrier protein
MSDNSPMKAEEIRAALLELLTRVAPDIDPAAVLPDVEYRDQFDFDSMDLFHLAVAIHERFGVDVPENQYRQLLSLDRGTAYLLGRIK